MRLVYPENEPAVDLFGELLPAYDDDLWRDDDGETEEWEPVDMALDLHEEMYTERLFDD